MRGLYLLKHSWRDIPKNLHAHVDYMVVLEYTVWRSWYDLGELHILSR